MEHLINAIANHPSLLRLTLWINEAHNGGLRRPAESVELWINFISTRCRLKAIDFGRVDGWLGPADYMRFANALLKNHYISHISIELACFFSCCYDRVKSKKIPIKEHLKIFQDLLDTFSRNDYLTSFEIPFPKIRFSQQKMLAILFNFIKNKNNLQSLSCIGDAFLYADNIKDFLNSLASSQNLVSVSLKLGINWKHALIGDLKPLTNFALSNFKLTELCFSFNPLDNYPLDRPSKHPDLLEKINKITDIVHFRLLIRASNAIAFREPGDLCSKKSFLK